MPDRHRILHLTLGPCEHPACPKRAGDGAAPAMPPPRLTPQQLAVIAHLAAGKTSKQAAVAIGVAIATVELHLRCARKRAGCLTTAELVARAVRAGLV